MSVLTEAQIQAAMQDAFQAMSEFDDSEVVINDWSVFDTKKVGGARVLIHTSQTDRFVMRTSVPQNEWTIPVMLIEPFVVEKASPPWVQTYNNVVTRRDAIMTKFSGTDGASELGKAGLMLDEIRSVSIVRYYWTDQEVYPLYILCNLEFDYETF